MVAPKITKAIIPVAGLGTRFLPATKAQPKEMLPIVDKPIIQYLVEEAVASGIKEIIFVTGKEKRAIEDHFDESHLLEKSLYNKGKIELAKSVKNIAGLAKFAYVRQSEPNGNGAALLVAAHLIGEEPVAVMFGDDIIDSETPTLKKLMEIYYKRETPVVALKRITLQEAPNYGIVKARRVRDNLFRISKIVEKPKPEKAPSNIASIARYIITKDIFDILRRLEKQLKPGVKMELGITHALDHYLKKRPIFGYEIEGDYYDCGSKLGFLKAIINYGLKHSEVGEGFKYYLKNLKL